MKPSAVKVMWMAPPLGPEVGRGVLRVRRGGGGEEPGLEVSPRGRAGVLVGQGGAGRPFGRDSRRGRGLCPPHSGAEQRVRHPLWSQASSRFPSSRPRKSADSSTTWAIWPEIVAQPGGRDSRRPQGPARRRAPGPPGPGNTSPWNLHLPLRSQAHPLNVSSRYFASAAKFSFSSVSSPGIA